MIPAPRDPAPPVGELVDLTRLADTTGHPEEWSRVWGARALLCVWDEGALRLPGVAGGTEHVATEREASTDPDEDVRRHVARALEALEQRLDLV